MHQEFESKYGFLRRFRSIAIDRSISDA